MNYLGSSSTSGYRSLNLLGFLTCLAALVFAVGYLQGTLGLDPCPLCMISRLVVLAIGTLFFMAFVHNPRRAGQQIYAFTILLLGLGGCAINLRHIWLQNLPKDQVPECGPGLDYLLQNFPVEDALAILFKGSGECAEIQWQLAGLSLPQLTLGFFLVLLVISVRQLRKRARSYFS